MPDTEFNHSRGKLAEAAYAEFRVRLEDGGAEEFEGLCKKHSELEVELRQLHANWDFVSGVMRRMDRTPQVGPDTDSEGFTKRVVDRLSGRKNAFERYRIDGRIDEGGQGAILRVWDNDLGRRLAMKVMHARKAKSGESPPKSDSRALGRFLEEAQVTGQLDHPGIVPVHELGLDEAGRVYFTMKLVKGESLKRLIDRVHKGDGEWTLTRVLGLILKVCDATAYAHSKGVLHRDIKPSNVMIGRFGEVHLMDWGLAKVMGREEAPIETAEPKSVQYVRSDRTSEPETPDSPLLTADGDVIGTPAYMSPEQGAGDLNALGPATDVYSIGAMLYQLLSGEIPYMPKGLKLHNYDVLCAVIAGPPRSIHELASSAPPEVLAICDKAMAREISKRYSDVSALGEDLRAYLENRVVGAHRTGAAVEFRKWVGRNRAVASIAAVLLVVLIVAGFVVADTERSRREQAEGDRDQRMITGLPALVDSLGPTHPHSVSAKEAWLADAERLSAKLPQFEEELETLERALSETQKLQVPKSAKVIELEQVVAHKQYQLKLWRGFVAGKQAEIETLTEGDARQTLEREAAILSEQCELLEPSIRALEFEIERERTWTVPEVAEARRLSVLTEAVWSLRALTRKPGGLIERVRSELQMARDLERDSLEVPRSEWADAIVSISDEGRSPLYGGLKMKPQLGLIPLGQNDAGLWEFWHVLSGSRPQPKMEGGYEIRPETGVVFILIPGGDYFVGAQVDDPSRPNYSAPSAYRDGFVPRSERAVRSARLDAFFLAKYELTQSQWVRLMGSNPSMRIPGADYRGEKLISSTHPVENMSWGAAMHALSRWNLTLPTEAQWEVSARAGTEGPYWWGASPGMVFPFDNFADARVAGVRRQSIASGLIDDGWALHAPVDTFPPNPWGLVSITGNVGEWCLDWYEEAPSENVPLTGSGLTVPKWSQSRAYRGGTYLFDEIDLRVSRRSPSYGGGAEQDVGVRPVQLLAP